MRWFVEQMASGTRLRFSPNDARMKRIPLTRGRKALVNDNDFEWLSQWRWCATKGRKTFYAKRNIRTQNGHSTLSMHRAIATRIGLAGAKIDHKNRNGLDNRRQNLRSATSAQNMVNRGLQRNNQSGFRGVSWDKVNHRWIACIWWLGRRYFLGRHTTKLAAAMAYNDKALELHGDFACVNAV